MVFFSYFPKVAYSPDGTDDNIVVATNLLVKARVLETIKNNRTVFYTYDVKDGETPEMIAHKYYKDPQKHWIVLFANNIVDPLHDWVMDYGTFNRFIASKYGSIVTAQSTIDHYNKIITKTDGASGTVTVSKHVIDATTFAALQETTSTINLSNGNTVTVAITKETIYAYDNEVAMNDAKRNIKLLDRSYVDQIETELKNLLAGN